MDREKGLWHRILNALLATLTLMPGCARAPENEFTQSCISFILQQSAIKVKAMMPDEEKISNVNLYIFDSHGHLEQHIYSDKRPDTFDVNLLKGETYTITALVNFGMKVNIADLDKLDEIDFHLVYPDEYTEGMPMYVKPMKFTVTSSGPFRLNLIRLMSKISIRMDRSRLSKDVSIGVTGIRIGNCPRRMKVFQTSKVYDEGDCFAVGFSHQGYECSGLNSNVKDGMSGSLSVYMLENMQGSFGSDAIETDDKKVFDQYDTRAKTCSYIEIDMDYTSDSWISSEGPLKYRFYLGDSRNNLDVERNCHYSVTVCPTDDGIEEDSWRIDTTNLQYVGQTLFEPYPSDYIRGDIGDTIHIGCRTVPSNAPFDIGIDYLEYDKERGIYEYEIDPDGHGVTLTLTGPGTGLIYMEAGEPINDGALFMIEVNKG